jgi:hypothetical protein
LPLPIDDDKELEQFRREWKLTRKDEAGLSVVAPFIHESLKAERLLQAVAVHFFTRILRGELVVEVMGTELGTVTLNKSTIAAACERIMWDGPKRTKRHVAAISIRGRIWEYTSQHASLGMTTAGMAASAASVGKTHIASGATRNTARYLSKKSASGH